MEAKNNLLEIEQRYRFVVGLGLTFMYGKVVFSIEVSLYPCHLDYGLYLCHLGYEKMHLGLTSQTLTGVDSNNNYMCFAFLIPVFYWNVVSLWSKS